MTVPGRSEMPTPAPEPISRTFRRLLRAGFTTAEAANLAAVRIGVPVTAQPWTLRQLCQLLFLRELRRTDRCWADADDTTGDIVPLHLPMAPTPAAHQPVEGRPIPYASSFRRDDGDPADGRVTLLSLFRAIAGPTASLEALRPSERAWRDAIGGDDREGG